MANIIRFSCIWVVLVIINTYSIVEASTATDKKYVVAFAEMSRSFKGSSADRTLANLRNVQDIFEKNLVSHKVDIVVMPESVINEASDAVEIPQPNVNKTLCVDNKAIDLVGSLSCLAKKYNTYAVFNIKEKVKCTKESQEAANDDRPCAPDGLTRYNVNVVFNRTGGLIAKYRKVNPYIEPSINTTLTPDYAIFETDFGVKFATAICFDILFKTPMKELVDKYKITDIAYPTYWFAELPFFTALQVQQGWSYSNNVNFIASGGSVPSAGTTGSGVYAGKAGYLKAVINGGSGKSEMFVTEIPKHGQPVSDVDYQKPNATKLPRRLVGLGLNSDMNVKNYESKQITKTGKIEEEVCFNNSVCCNFKIDVNKYEELEAYKHYNFRMVAFSGIRTTARTSGSYRLCALIACTDNNLASCGRVFGDKEKVQNLYYFKNIEIKGKFITPENKTIFFMPSTVHQDFLPLSPKFFEYTEKSEGNNQTVEIKTSYSNSEFLTFGIFGLDFDADSSARQNIQSYNFLILGLIWAFRYVFGS